MNATPEISLLTELGRLARKYGPETFDRLAKTIRSPEMMTRLADLLGAVSEAARKVPAKPRKPTGVSADEAAQKLLDQLEKTAPEKANVLRLLYHDLRQKKHLPHARDIMVFLGNGGKASSRKSRPEALVSLLQSMAQLPLDQLQNKIRDVADFEQNSERSLEGWSRIILGKREVKRSS